MRLTCRSHLSQSPDMYQRVDSNNINQIWHHPWISITRPDCLDQIICCENNLSCLIVIFNSIIVIIITTIWSLDNILCTVWRRFPIKIPTSLCYITNNIYDHVMVSMFQRKYFYTYLLYPKCSLSSLLSSEERPAGRYMFVHGKIDVVEKVFSLIVSRISEMFDRV